MQIAQCMKRNVVSVNQRTTVREAAALFVSRHIGMLPVVDDHGKLLGVTSLRDLLTLELPDFVGFVADVDFVHDFGAVEDTRPSTEALEGPVTTLMKPAFTVDEECGLLRAYALMLQHNLHDMAVVTKDGKLVGVASRVDIGTAILSAWDKVEK